MNIYKIFKILLLTIAFSALISGCLRVQTPQPPGGLPAEPSDPGSTPTPDLSAYRLPTREPGAPLINPSPDAERVLPPIRADFTQHIVQYGDTLNAIAFYFGVDVNALIEANQPIDPEMLEIGRLLQIPPPIPVQDAPGFTRSPIPNWFTALPRLVSISRISSGSAGGILPATPRKWILQC